MTDEKTTIIENICDRLNLLKELDKDTDIELLKEYLLTVNINTLDRYFECVDTLLYRERNISVVDMLKTRLDRYNNRDSVFIEYKTKLYNNKYKQDVIWITTHDTISIIDIPKIILKVNIYDNDIFGIDDDNKYHSLESLCMYIEKYL